MHENQLLQASLAGNEHAFADIVERYQSVICAITYSATGDLALSEDLAQETFIAAWKQLRNLRKADRLRAWLCGIARNLAKQAIRRRRCKFAEQTVALESVHEAISTASQPHEYAISREERTIVWQSLEKIPEKYREPLVLFYRQQRSVKKVAALLGLSETVVKQRLSRGRKMLKGSLSTIVADTLARTGPKKAFTIAVVAALPALAPQAATAGVVAVAAKGSAAPKTVGALTSSAGVLGSLGGLIGGLFGTWVSIVRTKSLRERRFMLRVSIIFWLYLLLLIASPLVLAIAGMIPKWVVWLSFGIFFALLVPSIIWVNRRQQQIQKENGTHVRPEGHPVKMSKASIYGAFGGSILGAVCWVISMSIVTRDWLVAVVGLSIASLIFVVSTKKCLRDEKRYWQIAIWDVIVLCALHFLVVNLRWNRWITYFKESERYLMYSRVPVWLMNSIIGVVCGGLVFLFMVMSKKQNKLLKGQSKKGIEK